jgi:hypothetical protein
MEEEEPQQERNLIYEDEELPDIEIYELVDIAEILRDQPWFVAMSKEELSMYAFNLLKDQQKVEAFLAIHEQITRPPALKPLPKGLIPIIANERRTVQEEESFVSQYTDAMRAPTFALKQHGLDAVFFPLKDTSKSDDVTLYDPLDSRMVGIAGGAQQTTIIHPRDAESHRLPLTGAAFHVPPIADSSYVSERANQRSALFKLADEHIGADAASVLPTFEATLESLQTPASLHDIAVHFERHTHPLDTLSDAQLAAIAEKLESDASKTEANQEHPPHKRTHKIAKLFRHANSLYLKIADAVKHTSDPELEKRMEVFRTYMDSISPTSVSDTPLPKDVVDVLKEDAIPVEEIVAHLRRLRNERAFEHSRKRIEAYQRFSEEDMTESLEDLLARWQRVKTDDNLAHKDDIQLLDIYKDMAEIKNGQSDENYEGNPERPDAMQFDAPVIEETDDASFLEDDPEPAAADSMEPAVFDGIEPGARETIEEAFPTIYAIHRASGVPLDFAAIAHSAAPHITRTARADFLAARVPILAKDVQTQILQSAKLPSALAIAQNILNAELSDQVVAAVKDMHAEHSAALKLTRNLLLAAWVLWIQDAAIRQTLDFDPLRGNHVHLALWSPFGAPVTPESKKKPEGALQYIAHVTADILLDEPAHAIYEEVVKTINTHYQDNVRRLQVAWEAAKDNVITNISDKAKAAELSLAEAIKLKQVSRVQSDFIRVLLYLPGLIAGSARVPSGCCLQQLTADFQADSDLKKHMNKVKELKDRFGRKRVSNLPRPVLGTIEPVATEENTAPALPLIVPADEAAIITTVDFKKTLEWAAGRAMVLLPSGFARMFSNDSKDAVAQSEKNIELLAKTTGQRASTIAILKSTLTASPQTLRSILSAISVALYHQLISEIIDTQREYLQRGIDAIAEARELWQRLSGLIDVRDVTAVQRILCFVCTRAMTLPAVPEDANNGILVLRSAVDANFLTATLTAVLRDVLVVLNNAKMPTLEEQMDYITQRREEQKIFTLNVLNNLNVEDREMILQARKLGIYNYDRAPMNSPDDIDADGAAEFRMADQEADADF